MSNSCAMNATGPATDPLGREVKAIAPIFRWGAIALAIGLAAAVVAAGGVAVLAAAHHLVHHALAICPIYFHANGCQ